MLNILIRNELLYPNTVLMGIFFLAGCALLGCIWQRLDRSSPFRRIFIISLVILAIVWMTGMIFCRPPDHDEIEHASAAWQMSKGLLPFQDFFQHHSPMLWILVAPLFHIPFISAHPADSIRILSTAVSLCALLILIRTAKLVWKEKQVTWIVILLFAGNFLAIQLYNLRPDLLANVFALSAFLVILKHRGLFAFAIAGMLLGFTISLSPKYLPFLFLLPFFMLIHRQNWRFYLQALGVHGFGFVLGLLPLFLWLIHHDLLISFYRWVLTFNANRFSTGNNLIGGKFQLIPTAFAIWGCSNLIRSHERKIRDQGQWIIVMLILSAMVYLNPSKYHFEYYEQMYILTAIIAAVGPLNNLLGKWFASARTIPAFLLIGVICWAGIHETQRGLRDRNYTKGREIIQTFQQIAGPDAVICIPPDHPITSQNATYISTGWQYSSWLTDPGCRDHLQNLVQEIEARKPAIILNKVAWPPDTPDFPEYLQIQGILTSEEVERLQNDLHMHYHLLQIGKWEFWIRNDRYEKFSKMMDTTWSPSS